MPMNEDTADENSKQMMKARKRQELKEQLQKSKHLNDQAGQDFMKSM